jgi:toxin secretion/phage lysis holin
MKEIWNWVQLALAAVGGFLGWFLGGLDGFLYALIAFVAVDYLTGVFCAIADKKLSSEIGARGIFKKVLIFVLVGVAHILDTQILGGTGDSSGAIRTAVIFFYLSNEGVSLLENSAHLGLPIPDKLKAVLQQLHGQNEEPPSAGDGT